MANLVSKTKLNTAIDYSGSFLEAGGRQGRLVAYKKANLTRKKCMNLVWGL